MKKIIHTRSDGGVSIVYPVRNTVAETLTTDAEIEQRAWDKLPADAINPRWADASEIPTDRSFRNAWEDSGAITVNMPKAREIQEKRIESARRQKIRDLMEREELGENVVADKATVRIINAKALCAAAQTPEELKAIWPIALGPRI